jgi:hypothetical protein
MGSFQADCRGPRRRRDLPMTGVIERALFTVSSVITVVSRSGTSEVPPSRRRPRRADTKARSASVRRSSPPSFTENPPSRIQPSPEAPLELQPRIERRVGNADPDRKLWACCVLLTAALGIRDRDRWSSRACDCVLDRMQSDGFEIESGVGQPVFLALYFALLLALCARSSTVTNSNTARVLSLRHMIRASSKDRGS